MARLILTIISILMQEAALVVIVLWALPRIDVQIPLSVLVVLMVAWGLYSVIVYRVGSRLINRKRIAGLPDMVGSQGKVVTSLVPEGLVRIKGELWVAKSISGEVKPGGEVVVIGQDRLKLVVGDCGPADDLVKAE